MNPTLSPLFKASLVLTSSLLLLACDTEPEGRPQDGRAPSAIDNAGLDAAPVYRVDGASRYDRSGKIGQSTGRFIVILKEEEVEKASMGAMMDIFSDVRIEETIDAPKIHGFASPLTEDELERLRYEPEVAFIEEEQLFTLDAPTNLWGLDRIDQPSLPLDSDYTVAADGTGVNAYIIDSGIRSTHSQFGGRVGPGFDGIGGGTGDCNGHGTHVAGTVGGSTVGVASNVTLYPVRVFGCGSSTSTTTIINGVNWVAQNATLPAVANMSLGGGQSAALDQAVESLIGTGVTVVVAAGNENQNACNVSPARTPSAVTVASSTQSDNRSSFSNWGNCVDVFAPGSNILSAWPTNDSAGNTISGTSMASPHVAGAAALYLQANPGASPAQVGDAILSNATQGAISGTNGSPNRLLYTDFIGDGGDGGGGDPPPPPPPPPPAGGCEESCGGQSPDGCWCDDQCTQFGDCCANYEDACVAPPPDPNSCEQNAVCGNQAPGGCWCDAQCVQFGDCCADGPC